jgi:hypothetical protein
MAENIPLDERRWRVETSYGGAKPAVWYIEELSELRELVEAGPDWNTIAEIRLTLNRPSRDPELARQEVRDALGIDVSRH